MNLIKCGFVFAIFGALISGIYLRNNNTDKELYASVRVAFPDDLCDKREIKMPDFNAPGRRISEVKCLEYIWRIRYEAGKEYNSLACVISNGGTTHRVAGGQVAAYGEYPHMAALGWKAKVGTWIFMCGGSLISEKFIITAAHCSSVPSTDKTVANVKPSIARLTSENILDTASRFRALDAEIEDFKRHPQYDPLQHYYDIAVVELKKEIPFLWATHPSCLWTTSNTPDIGTVTGWGVVETTTLRTSPELQKAKIRLIDSGECNKTLHVRQSRKWHGVVRHQICAGDNTGRIDTCRGDSGGPLQSEIVLNKPIGFTEYNIGYTSWKLYKIVGVISFGFRCAQANTPGIYTRVESFISWIEDIVWPLNNVTNSKNYD